MKNRYKHTLLLTIFSLLTAESLAADTAPIQLHSKPSTTSIMLHKARQALQTGAFDEAARLYREALGQSPQNPDILLALAALARHQGQGSEALRYRQLAAEAAPLDVNVQASLLADSALDDPLRESRLKSLSMQHEHSPAPHFVLGKLYAGQHRWPEARAAYAKAHSADPGNPDYLFNLAVCHEHLQQPAEANQRYRQALTAAQQGLATFSLEQASSRLTVLNP